MKIESVKIDYLDKGFLSSYNHEGICHVKTLPYLSIVESIEGNYEIKLGNGETYKTQEGGFFIAPKDIQQTITHRENKETKHMHCRWVFLDIKINGIYAFDNLYELPVILPKDKEKEINEIFTKLFESDNPFDDNIYALKLVKILYSIAKLKENSLPQSIENAIEFIKNNYKEKITIEMLSQVSHLSHSYFYSLFSKTMGVSPITYLNNYRMSLSSEMLINTKKSISEIASSVGFEDSVYFNKTFKKAFNLSPTKYRELYKRSITL